MCCYSVELLVIPLLTIPAVILSVISMSSNSWLEAYIRDNPPGTQYLFGKLSPWYLCAAECTDCPYVRRTRLDCFWMRDWAATGFGRLTAVQHLEYWCMGSLILSLFPSLIVCLDRRGRICALDCRRPALILMGVACLLSLATMVVFGSGRYDGLDEFADGHTLYKILAWPFYVRLLATLLMCSACCLATLHEYKSRAGYMITESDEDKVIVVPVNGDDLIDEYPDYGDPL